jgi:hypothetical protein
MSPLRAWGTIILSVMAASAIVAGAVDLYESDGPIFRLNGPAGTLLIAPVLLTIVARFWHRVREVSWGEKTETTLSFAESWLGYASSIVFSVCLIGLSGLGFAGYQGKIVELVCDSLLLILGLGLLIHKLRNGRSELVLSPSGIKLRRAAPIAWDRVAAARMDRLPWTNAIVIELRQQDSIRILPTLLGADPGDLLRAIEVRRAAYTF